MLGTRLYPLLSYFQQLLKISQGRTSTSSVMRHQSSVLTQNGMSPETSPKPPVFQLTIDPLITSSMASIGAQLLKDGGIIAIPTDTLYGLAVDSHNTEAISLLYEIKGRDCIKPIAICVAEISQIETWAKVTVSQNLLQDLLPGPVTLVFERHRRLNPNLNPKTDRIGIRIPDHAFTRQLAREHGRPFALTSANPSACPSTISPEEFKSLWPRLDGVFDGGRILPYQYHSICNSLSDRVDRSGSTVIDLSVPGSFEIIRKGIFYDNALGILKGKYNLMEITT